MTGESNKQRFGYHRATFVDFMAESLVVCPNCSCCAIVTSAGTTGTKSFVPHRLVCSHCGLAKEEPHRGLNRGWSDTPEDGVFHLPLWLQSTCCRHVLWAYNGSHLRFLNDYVGAELRERRRSPEHGWCNASLASRLPKWMQLAKNRNEILRVIGKLEQRLLDAQPKSSKLHVAPRGHPSNYPTTKRS